MTSRSIARIALTVLIALGPIVLAGCGANKPPVSTSKTEATVRGQVLVHGQPASGGLIWFDPANYLRKDAVAISTDVSQDGTYEITTLIGENSVRYEGPAVAGDRELDGTIQGFVVEEGINEFDVVLPVR